MTCAQPLDLRAAVAGGALFYALEDRNRVEAFIPPAGQENHAANLCALPAGVPGAGDLLCVWFAGAMEGHSGVRIALSRLPAGRAAWTEPTWITPADGRSQQNPLLFQAPTMSDDRPGPLWLLYTAQETRGCARDEWHRRVMAGEATGGYAMQWTAEVRRRLSWDGGHTWEAVETFAAQPGSFCRHPLLVTASGAWLWPMYYSREDAEGSHGADATAIWRSEDAGQSWREIDMPQSRGRVHASLVELAPDHVIAFLRSRAADRIYRSDSFDDGRSWAAPLPTELPNNNASLQACRLRTGEIVIAYNAYSANDDPTRTVWPARRYPLTLALSEDGGQTWPYRRHVDLGDGFAGPANEALNRRLAYPSIMQTDDGLLHLAYAFRGRQCIKYVRVSADWIRESRDRLF